MPEETTVQQIRTVYEALAIDLARAARDATSRAESLLYRNYRDIEPDQVVYGHVSQILYTAAYCLQRAAECVAQAPAEPVEAKGDEAGAA